MKGLSVAIGTYWSRDSLGLLRAAIGDPASSVICAFSPARRPQDDRVSPWRCCRVLLRSEFDRCCSDDGVGEANGSGVGDTFEPVNSYSRLASS